MVDEDINILKIPKHKFKEVPIGRIIRSVRLLSGKNLRQLYRKICGEDGILKLKNNKDMLRRRICYALQKQQYGGLSVKAYNTIYRHSLTENITPSDVSFKNKYHLPEGSLITRKWKNIEHTVRVINTGFEYNQTVYTSLSKVAKVITGHERSGPAFFGLKKQRVGS